MDTLKANEVSEISIEEILTELPDGFKLEKEPGFLKLSFNGDQVTCFKEAPTAEKLRRIISLCSCRR